jgi:hypothetical protein
MVVLEDGEGEGELHSGLAENGGARQERLYSRGDLLRM